MASLLNYGFLGCFLSAGISFGCGGTDYNSTSVGAGGTAGASGIVTGGASSSGIGGAGIGGSGGATTTTIGGGDPALFSQAPHCNSGTSALHIAGSLDGISVTDDRVLVGINAGFINGPQGHFDTPLAGGPALASNQVELHIQWDMLLAFGQQSSISGGALIPPTTHPRAGQSLCIVGGAVGFQSGGADDGAMKFSINSVREGADCSGAPVTVDLRGCYD